MIAVVDWDVINSSVGAVILVDPLTGFRTSVSNANIGSGPSLSTPWDIAGEDAGNLVVASGKDGVIRVDPMTRIRTSVFAFAAGTGVPLSSPRDVAIEDDG
ncbi:hypothetical protein C2W62_02905 [Candidatus Entotheonella serta]|nr:hypothetical protein C2W62_02905 [Candidatus Entotheonella serta]